VYLCFFQSRLTRVPHSPRARARRTRSSRGRRRGRRAIRAGRRPPQTKLIGWTWHRCAGVAVAASHGRSDPQPRGMVYCCGMPASLWPTASSSIHSRRRYSKMHATSKTRTPLARCRRTALPQQSLLPPRHQPLPAHQPPSQHRLHPALPRRLRVQRSQPA
jgi:hypothetical protein